MRPTHSLLLAALFVAAAAAAQAPAPLKTPAPARAGQQALEKQDIRAQLSPRRYTTLAAEVGARVSRVGVIEGGSFKAGQLLIQLDCSLQQAQLQKAKAALTSAEHTVNANRRLDELRSIGKVELDVSEAEAAKARAEVTLMNVSLGKCQIAAPFSGRVAEQRVREQQFVQAGQPLLDILDDSVLELEFIIPSHWLAWLKAGTAFQVKIDETGKAYPAKIQRIGARVDPVSQSIKVVAAIDGSYRELMAGMSGKILLAPPAQ